MEQLDLYVDKYGFRDELQKIAPTYRDNQMKVDGKIYGFPDDGDVFILYYRKDLFEDPKNKEEFKAKYGYDLAPPKTWKEYDEIEKFLTEKYAPKIYGAGQFRQPAYSQLLFQERFRVEGGKFFDPKTMKATVNSDIGVKVFDDMRAENKFMPPGVETWGFVEASDCVPQRRYRHDHLLAAVRPLCRGLSGGEKALSWVPQSKIVDKVGYALPPGGRPQLALGFSLSVSSKSKNKEAAYLFIQWLNSEDESVERVQLPYTLRDPFREAALHQRDLHEALGRCAELSQDAARRGRYWTA